MNRFYFDHAATTPLLPGVAEAMAPWLGPAANPSALHAEGRRAKHALDAAREVVAAAMGCEFSEVVFTASGTEAANLAVLGLALANRDPARRRVLLGAAEHPCVLKTWALLERFGYLPETVPVDSEARVSPAALEACLGGDVLLVAVMHANNELGTVSPVAELAECAHRCGSLFVCDMVQSFPQWQPVALGVDLAVVSSHKLGGPTGAGALLRRGGAALEPIVVGGSQERGARAGTEPVAALVGFAEAVRQQAGRPDQRSARDALGRALVAAGFVPSVADWTAPGSVLSGHLHGRFPGLDAETLLVRFDREGLSASSGSACSSGSLEPSHVVTACGATREVASEALRFSLGRETTVSEALEGAEVVLRAVAAVKEARRGTGRGSGI